ncbi:DNA cytosine methyltransferase [uncultured Acetobacteroides sp.]|uniref:DNA cytosine methyltransferase n=1 Tax=uncultured Acetobacteroides sp. TaxID=1760811 RepID=UPI0029F5477D|nr:DNA cytosine methyltransferase [uncultured Acetobacteroides sp.]
MKNKIFKILSIFTGGGFLDIGFINNGFQIEEAVEIDQSFIYGHNKGFESYFATSNNYYIKNNLISNTLINRPIDASDDLEINKLGKKHHNICGIIGGPPCQDYSTGGKNAGVTGNRGKLIFSYCRIVDSVKPDFIVFENVTGLVSTKVHKEEGFDILVNKLKDLGYEIWYDVLNSLEYGLPQDRPRVVLVGFRREIVTDLTNAGYILEKDNLKLKTECLDNVVFRWPTVLYQHPKKLKWPTRNTFRNELSKGNLCLDLEIYDSMTVTSAFCGLSEQTPNQNEFFKPKSNKFDTIEEGDTNRKSFKRLHRYRYSPTVAYGNNEVHLHPTEARRLSVREALRLQTVPDNYILPKDMTLTSKFKLISNGVPTKKAELIAKEIRRTLLLWSQL